MAITVLQLVKGTPFSGRKISRDNKDNYELLSVSVDGEKEKAILEEASCWELVCKKENVFDDEEQGKWESLIGIENTPLTDCGGEYIVWNGELVGIKLDGSLYFFSQSYCVGGNVKYVTISVGDRDEEYDRYTYSLKKVKSSNRKVYYAPIDDNQKGIVYGVTANEEKVTIEEGAKVVLDDAFKNCYDLRSINFPASFCEIENFDALLFEGSRNITEITVDTANPVFHAQGNCLIKTAEKLLVAGGVTCVIPTNDSVTKICDFAFYRSGISSIVIPENIVEVGEYAFAQSWLESVVIPKTLAKVGRGAFGYCNDLHIYFAGTTDEWTDCLQKEFGNFRYLYKYSESKPTVDGKFWHYDENGNIVKW